ncbi:MAG: PcfJ domain-containing protein [Oscillospiraceae bacterium]|nr:PcfJ domain-containing protein [Oscillospiraceae bacterium]
MKNTKELLALPVPICPAVELPEDTRLSAHTGIRNLYFTAQTIVLHGEEFLGVTVYGRDKQPMRRWWLTQTQSAMQSFQTVKDKFNHQYNRQPGRLYEAAIDTELRVGLYWYETRDCLIGTREDRKTVRQFTKGSIKGIGEMIAAFQRMQRDTARERTRAKQREAIQKRFSFIPREPEDFDTWICDGPMLSYRWFLYTYTGKKKQSGVCTHCGKSSELDGVKTGTDVICPGCGSKLHCRSWKRLPRYGIWEEEKVALYQYAGSEIVVRAYRATMRIKHDDLTGVVKRKLTRVETYRYFLDPAALHIIKAAYSDRYGKKSISVGGFNECGEDYGYLEAYVCPIGLEEIRRKLGIWTPVEELAKRGLCCNAEGLLNQLKKRPELEYLAKMGLYALTNWEMAQGNSTSLLKGVSVTDILGVDKLTVQKLRQTDVDGDALRLVREFHKNGVTLATEDISALDRLKIKYRTISLLKMAKASSAHKAIRYVTQQTNANTDADDVLNLWSDYVGMAKEIGINLSDGMRLFPRKLRTAHDEAAKIIEIRENAEIDKGIRKTAEDLDDLHWEKYGLLIRPARSHMELFEEGKKLSHCVGRKHYAMSMAEGKTAIFFIRREKKPDIPYVTLELSLTGWHKIQCYGKGDSWPGKSVDTFVNAWLRDVVRPARKAMKGEKTA